MWKAARVLTAIISLIAASEMARASAASNHAPPASDAALCALLQAKQEFRHALEHCDRAATVDSADVTTLSNRGSAHFLLGYFDLALADFEAAIEKDPTDAANYFNRALVQSAQGKHDQAVLDYSKALELMPTLVAAYVNRGSEFEKLGDRERAIADYRQALLSPRR